MTKKKSRTGLYSPAADDSPHQPHDRLIEKMTDQIQLGELDSWAKWLAILERRDVCSDGG